MPIPLLITFYILFPVLVIYLCYRFEFINKIGAVVICYIVGITIGNIGIFPVGVDKYQMMTSEAAVAIALPLLLFSVNIKKWSRLAGKTLLSMLIATVVIVVIATVGFLYINGREPHAWKLAGMAIGVYTGGTPNLAAIKSALSVDPTTFIIMHTYDTLISIIFIIFCITVAQRLFLKILPPFKKEDVPGTASAGGDVESEDIHSYQGIFRLKTALPLLGALVLSVVVVGLSDLFSGIFPKSYTTSIVILSITTLGIAGSFIPAIRNIDKTFQLGMYIIYIFCLVVGSMANFNMIIHININIMLFVIFCIFGTMLFHALFCKIFKIDTDTFIITSVSAICSPPFVPVVAGALKNREVILSGITTGIIGYAIGNYLGISVAYIIKAVF